MALLPKQARSEFMLQTNPDLVSGKPSGTINYGDFLRYSGEYVIATVMGGTSDRASAAGVALDASPVTDQYGVSVTKDTIPYARAGVFKFRAAFSGRPALGIAARPNATGSAFRNVTGHTGAEPTWQTGTLGTFSGATAFATKWEIGRVIGWDGSDAVAGTGRVIVAFDLGTLPMY